MAKFMELPIDQIDLDLDNPRIKRFMENYKNPTAENISLALGASSPTTGEGSTGTTYRSLKESIRTHKGIIHPIIVNQTSPGKFTVIEGNTRLAIYAEFAEQGVKGDWSKIITIVHDDLSPQEIDSIRLQAHLVGPRDWDPYSKAKYLNNLRSQAHLTMNEIVDFCGGKRKEVEDYIAAYHDMEKYYRAVLEDGESFEIKRFSAFIELQKTHVKDSIAEAGHDLEDFSRWVKNRLIHPLNSVRSLPQILPHSKAKAVFLKDGAREALKVLSAGTKGLSLEEADIDSLANALRNKIAQLPFEDYLELKKNPSSPHAVALLNLEEDLVVACNEFRGED